MTPCLVHILYSFCFFNGWVKWVSSVVNPLKVTNLILLLLLLLCGEVRGIDVNKRAATVGDDLAKFLNLRRIFILFYAIGHALA